MIKRMQLECFPIHLIEALSLFLLLLFFNLISRLVISDFGAQENKVLSLFPLFPHLFTMK